MENMKARLLEELGKTNGIVAYACKQAGVSRVTFYKYCNDDPEFKEQVENIVELQIDIAEAALIKKIGKGDIAAIIFYLKTKGKKRGYVERQEIQAEVSGKIETDVDFSKLSDGALREIANAKKDVK